MCIVGAYFEVIFDFAQLILIKKELVEFLISSQIGYKRDIVFISLLPLPLVKQKKAAAATLLFNSSTRYLNKNIFIYAFKQLYILHSKEKSTH
ncbi:hypothetical protein [Bacillus salipaludis]|uniref:hypothetical protein n=1 Tax=Bacillus salipaludis TaxID=2547811 RepID=UPI0014054D74|nr:hypothetical protein [Bacillus salipaludis]